MKKGQVWIETVIYTLIGLAIIGVVLAIVTPRINEFRDRTVIEQTIDSLELFDAKIQEVVNQGPGNVRLVSFSMKRGIFTIDPTANQLIFTIDDSRVLYSESGTPIQIGRVTVETTEGSQVHTVQITLDYPHNVFINEEQTTPQQFSAASLPYEFSIGHSGFDTGVVQLNISTVS